VQDPTAIEGLEAFRGALDARQPRWIGLGQAAGQDPSAGVCVAVPGIRQLAPDVALGCGLAGGREDPRLTPQQPRSATDLEGAVKERQQGWVVRTASPEQLRALGHDPVDTPSVDDRIEACQTAMGSDQPTCWAKLDQYMMEQVVPVVPILFPGIQTPFSTRVLHASIDQWTAVPALDQVALVPGAG
jgi:hypothetical protein